MRHDEKILPDMKIEFKQSERIALIDSAIELVKIFANRRPTIARDTIFDIEQLAYKAALEFLAIQYNGQCRVDIALPKMPEMSETDLGCM